MKRNKAEEKRLKAAFKRALDKELREHKSSFRVFWVLRCLVILCIVRQFFLHN